MTVDWVIVATIAGPIIALPIGGWVNSIYEKRPKLIALIAHASAITITPPSGLPMTVNSHSLILRNAGKAPARKIKIGHYIMPPNLSVFPSRAYNLTQLQDNSVELSFDNILPKEQVVINYLYFAPLTFNNTTSYVKSDEQVANFKEAVIDSRPPITASIIAGILMLVGLISLIYLAVSFLLKI